MSALRLIKVSIVKPISYLMRLVRWSCTSYPWYWYLLTCVFPVLGTVPPYRSTVMMRAYRLISKYCNLVPGRTYYLQYRPPKFSTRGTFTRVPVLSCTPVPGRWYPYRLQSDLSDLHFKFSFPAILNLEY